MNFSSVDPNEFPWLFITAPSDPVHVPQRAVLYFHSTAQPLSHSDGIKE